MNFTVMNKDTMLLLVIQLIQWSF